MCKFRIWPKSVEMHHKHYKNLHDCNRDIQPYIACIDYHLDNKKVDINIDHYQESNDYLGRILNIPRDCMTYIQFHT